MMLSTAAMLQFPFGTTPELRERLATRHRWVWIKTAHETLVASGGTLNLTGPAEFSGVATLAAQLKSINPRVQVGMYVGGLASPDSHHPHYDWLDDADLLHSSPTQPLTWSPSQSPAEPQARRVKIINYNRPETRAKLIQHWRTFLADHNLDGVVFDTFHPAYYAAWMSLAPATPNANGGFGLPNGGVEGAFHTEAWWFLALSVFVWQLRWALGIDGREVWVNGLYDYPGYNAANTDHAAIGRGYTNVAQYASGLLAEYAHTMHKSPADLRGNIEAAQLVNAQNRGTFWMIHPGAFAYDPSGYTVTDSPDLRRFYLAAFLLMQKPPYTYHGYNPGPMYQAFETVNGEHVPWLFDGGEDWDQDYGVARTGVNWTGDVAWREYTRGYAIVNASSGYGYLTLPPATYRNWHPEAGGPVEITAENPGMNVPPKSGLFLFRSAA